ncbi:MAG: Carboxylesterase type [Bacteroidota bacterium]|nr:Carboxylesterase type [Bacteroidota bacterium]
MKKILLLSFLFFILKFHTEAQCNGRYVQDIFNSVTVIRDVQFGSAVASNGDTIRLTMDVYVPDGDVETQRPLILWAHGGSFLGGNKNTIESSLPCTAMAKKGYVTASINYRLESEPLALVQPEVMIKAVMRAVQDYKAAIRFFRRNAILDGNVFGIDTAQIIIGGDSAGSIAALHTAYMDDTNELEKNFRPYIYDLGGLEGNSGNPGFSSKCKAVINVSGALRDVKYMNNNTDIPVFSCHNEVDLTIPYGTFYPYFIPSLPMVSGSQVISAQARRLGMYYDLYTVSGTGHVPYLDQDSGRAAQPVFDSMINKMTRFLYRILDCNQIVLKVNTQMPQNSFTVFPNPSGDIIHIHLPNNSNANAASIVQLFNVYGEKVMEQKFIPLPDNSISLDHLQKGIYLIRLSDHSSNVLATEKIIYQ